MSRLPEPGEARAAAEVLGARIEAVTGDDHKYAQIHRDTGEVLDYGETGGESAVRGAYGDLFDLHEMAVVAEGPVNAFIADIATGAEPDVAMRSMYLLAVAHGCLMERARWQR